MNPKDFALNLIRNNPQVRNNPNASEFISVIERGDVARGTEIANNLCRTYGITPEEALRQATGFFGIGGMR